MLRHKLSYALVLLLLCAGLSVFAQERPGGGPPPGGWGRPGGGQERRPGGEPGGPERRPGAEQGRPPDGRRGPGGPPDGGGFDFLSVETRFDPAVVKDTPYSAQAVIEHTQILGDGTRIQRRETAMAYRDSAGRTRREQTIKGFGPIEVAGGPITLAFISDPVGGFNYVINQGMKLARKMPALGRPGPPPDKGPDGAGEKEDLGKQTIEGIEAVGARFTITIPAGQFGNDRPVKIVSERWYAPSLQVTMMSRHSDPRLGESVYRLTNIKRAEPARELFEIPAGYRLEKDDGPRGRPGDGPRPKRPEEF